MFVRESRTQNDAAHQADLAEGQEGRHQGLLVLLQVEAVEAHLQGAGLTMSKGPNGKYLYSEFDNNKDMTELEDIQAWLMDPILCPTSWPTLLQIRRDNHNYTGTGTPVMM